MSNKFLEAFEGFSVAGYRDIEKDLKNSGFNIPTKTRMRKIKHPISPELPVDRNLHLTAPIFPKENDHLSLDGIFSRIKNEGAAFQGVGLRLRHNEIWRWIVAKRR